MASLQFKGESWYCQFLYHGKRHLMRLKQDLLQLPPGMDIVTFIEFDGKPPRETPVRDCLALGSLRDHYLETHRNGSLEQSTL